MCDRGPTDPVEFERWLAGELRRSAPADPARTARVMARVRAVPRPTRRPWVPPVLGLLVAAGVAGLVAVHPLALAADAGAVGRPVVLATAGALRDTMAATLRDTIRGAVRGVVSDTVWLVRFALIAPSAARVAVAGDFNGWNPRATPLLRQSASGEWTGAVPMPAGRHRYAFVVDDSQWVADPARRIDAGRAWSVRLVPDTSD